MSEYYINHFKHILPLTKRFLFQNKNCHHPGIRQFYSDSIRPTVRKLLVQITTMNFLLIDLIIENIFLWHENQRLLLVNVWHKIYNWNCFENIQKHIQKVWYNLHYFIIILLYCYFYHSLYYSINYFIVHVWIYLYFRIHNITKLCTY